MSNSTILMLAPLTAQQVAVIDRMAQPLLLGDQPDLDLDHLLGIVPSSFASAAERGMGMVSCTAVFE